MDTPSLKLDRKARTVDIVRDPLDPNAPHTFMFQLAETGGTAGGGAIRLSTEAVVSLYEILVPRVRGSKCFGTFSYIRQHLIETYGAAGVMPPLQAITHLWTEVRLLDRPDGGKVLEADMQLLSTPTGRALLARLAQEMGMTEADKEALRGTDPVAKAEVTRRKMGEAHKQLQSRGIPALVLQVLQEDMDVAEPDLARKVRDVCVDLTVLPPHSVA